MFQLVYQYLLSLSGLTALVGTYMIILSYMRNGLYEKVRQKGIKTEGVVVEMYQNPGSFFGGIVERDGSAPIVEFTTVHGTHRYISTTYQKPSPYTIGQSVNIWYQFYKSNKEMALEDDVPGDTPQKFFKWGIILCGISYPLIYLKMRQMF